MCARGDDEYISVYRERVNKYVRWVRRAIAEADDNDLRTEEEKLRTRVDKMLSFIEKIKNQTVKLYLEREEVKANCKDAAEILKKLQSDKNKAMNFLKEEGFDPLLVEKQIKEREAAVKKRFELIKEKELKVDQAEQEVVIKQEKLRERLSDLELALKSRYTLTETQKKTLITEKDMILDGVEEWGSIAAACKHNSKITSKVRTIMMYASVFPEFQQAIEVSKNLFKDKVQALLVERAVQGTPTPIFSKGEFVGDYNIIDNKMLMKVVEAEMPDKYGKKAESTTTKNTQNNIQIISYKGVDETKFGYKKNIGLVTNVQDSGKVERITQEEKMRRFYEDKEDTEIIDAEVEDENSEH